MMAFKAIEIQVSNYGTRFKAYFNLYINCFLYHLFEISQCMVLLLYFNFNKGFRAFSKIINYN